MSQLELIIGNVCSFCATASDSISTTRKSTKSVLRVQNISQFFYFVATIVLKGYSSSVQNVVSILRNVVAIRGIKSKVIEWTLTIMGVVFGIVFNNLGLVGYLPILANLQYTLVVFQFRDNDLALKISFLVAVGLFVVFNLAIWNFVGAFFNLATFIVTGITLIRQKILRKKA